MFTWQTLPSHLFPKSPCWFDGRLQPSGLDHHRLSLLIFSLHVAVVLLIAHHPLQLGVANLVQASHRSVHPLTLHCQGVQ